MSTEAQTADTGIAPDQAYTSIQASDDADSEAVATLTGHPNLSDYVADGLRVADGSLNWAEGRFDLTEGKAFWLIEEISDRESDEHSWHQCLFTSYYPGVSAVSFDTTQPQHVFARCDGVEFGSPGDSPKIDVLADPEPATEDSIRIATLDPGTQTVTYHNQNPDGVFESLEADSVVIHDALEAEGLVDTAELADGAVTEPKHATGGVSQRAIDNNAVGSGERIDESVIEADMADNSVPTRAYQDESIVASVLAAESVVTRAVMDGALTTPKYADRSITSPKIADAGVNTRNLAGRSVTPSRLDANKAFRMAGLTSTQSVALEGSHATHHPRGSANGEVLRMGGGASDSLIQVQSGGGRLTWTWNAEHEPSDDEFHYIEGGEPAMGIRMYGGQIDFFTATAGNEGAVIDWEQASVDNGGISNAHALGGIDAGGYLRKHGIMAVKGDELTLLQDKTATWPNTSQDLVFENQPSGDRVHMNYARPELRMFEQDRFRNPFWVAMKNGNFRPGQALQLLSTGNVRRPPKIGANVFYNGGQVRAINDAGNYAVLGDFS